MNRLRGSIWSKCDFHIHTPCSGLGHEFGNEFDFYVTTMFKKAIEKNISVIGITDYFTIDGYKKIKTEYLQNGDKLSQLFSADEIEKIKDILVLPNIEFRLNKIVQIIKVSGKETKTENGRINFHILFSDDVPIKTIEENFLHDIDFIYESEPDEKDKRKKLKVDNLIRLGEKLKAEQPDILGSSLEVGMTNAVVNDEEIVKILTENNDFKDKYFIVLPSDEDLSKIQWKSQDGLTRKVLLSRSHAFFSSNPSTIEFGLGEKALNVEEFISEFKSIKPCIWGSDAHDYDKLFEPDKERYCWIKADPTFQGMRQILFEPKDRVFIGKYPLLYERIKNSRHNYINSLTINKIPGYNDKNGIWFENFELQFGFELIAIIGNKGKGKSAIADVLGLLGNAHIDKKDFSFLKNDKFCQKGYSENFIGNLKWFDNTESKKSLDKNIDTTDVERVKYIPQSYLEKLCNNEDGAFKEEINKVVFSRLDESDKLGKTSFSELETAQTLLINQKIAELKIKLSACNKNIEFLESKSTAEYRKSIENKLGGKKSEFATHEKEFVKIAIVINPELNSSMSADQRQKAERLSVINEEIIQLEIKIELETKKLYAYKITLSELDNIYAEITLTVEKFQEWKNARAEHYQNYNLKIEDIIKLNYDLSKVEYLIKLEKQKIEDSSILLSKEPVTTGIEKSLSLNLNSLILEKEIIEKDLEKPFKDWSEYQRQLKEWEDRKKEIFGSADIDGTILFYERELAYLDNELKLKKEAAYSLRNTIVKDIYIQKQEIQQVYNKIKEAISNILKEYSKEQNITIETSFKIDKYFYSQFFDFVNRYGVFYSNGDEELKKMMLGYDFDKIDDVLDFINKLFHIDIRIKDGRKQDFYNFISSLGYVNPEYDLRLNNKSLIQLSPGEKGGLLLVFYLVLDKDNKPLIIDQPEDNLDNQSVAEILVPYIKTAKKKRQIIMVTHNPNLAIVADAEQIIYMSIDKENQYRVSCISGGIENSTINNHIVNILEGKMKAFDNRRLKYLKTNGKES